MIKIDIHFDGEHWDKTVKIFGITVYHRHDYTKDYKPRPIGFVTYPDSIVEVVDEFDCEDKKNKIWKKLK